MAQQQRSQGPSDPEATDGGMSDAPEQWGNGGLVGDGRYRLTRRLGRGGMAEVFAAEDVRLGRTVAVKLLRSDLAEDPTSKARFTREAQSVAGLNHHSIVAVYDSGEDVMANGQAVPYIVMEIVEGRTIRDLLLNAEAPGPEQALIIVSGVLEALAYSHQHGIVHRDIKPANVIITHNGAVKVMDFGIARALHGASTTMTQTGMVMGTPQYLSPEQALGKAVDHRSDLYATGCMLYELLALRPPFVGETPLSVVYQHVQDIPVPPSQASGGASPPELDGLAMRALAKEPDDRFQTAEEMRGLVQYGLQMLYDHGPHTGTWNTGPVTAPIAAHPVTGGYSSTTMMPQGGHGGATSQIPQPILPQGYGSGDDGGFEGHGNHGGGRGKLWILAVLAIIAIAAGVAIALQNTGGKGGGTDTTPTPTVSSSTSSDSSSPSPSETESDDSSDSSTENSTTSGGSGDYSDPSTPKPSPTPSKTQEQSSEPTPSGDDSPEPSSDPATTGDTSTGTTNQGSTGTSSGTNNGGTSDGGTSNGGTSEGSTTGLGGLTGG